jgi:hypothetical protein
VVTTTRRCGHRPERGGVVGVGDDQRRVGGRTDQVAHLLQLGTATARHRPARDLLLIEIFGNEAAGEAGRAIDDDVMVAHGSLLFCFRYR